jgi:hypothetical protein
MPISRARCHPLDRQERLARKPPAARRRCGQRRRPGQQQEDEQALDSVVDPIERLRDHEHVGTDQRSDHRAPSLGPARRLDGDQARAPGDRAGASTGWHLGPGAAALPA